MTQPLKTEPVDPPEDHQLTHDPQQTQRCQAAEQTLGRCRRTLMLGNISNTLAHDFNNLLGVISNSNHLLQRLCDDPAGQVAVAASLRAVATGTQLTALWQRLSTDRDTTVQAIDLRSFLLDAQDLARTIVGKRIRLSIHVAPGTWQIMAAPNQLELALIALLQNARDAMVDGGQLWIDARNAELADDAAAAGHIALTVTDDGVGIDESLAARAFEPYFTTREAQGASGLGLSQVKTFCEALGGTARLASTAGLGTAVTLLLPAADRSVVKEPPDESAGTTMPDDAEKPGGNAKLLLVEDSEEMAAVTSALLRSHGYQVRWAPSADEAWHVLERDDGIDVVLSDVVMPGALDGVGLARRVGKRWPDMPVVLITGQRENAARADDLPVLHKPCTPEILVATLQREMLRRQTRRSAP